MFGTAICGYNTSVYRHAFTGGYDEPFNDPEFDSEARSGETRLVDWCAYRADDDPYFGSYQFYADAGYFDGEDEEDEEESQDRLF